MQQFEKRRDSPGLVVEGGKLGRIGNSLSEVRSPAASVYSWNQGFHQF